MNIHGYRIRQFKSQMAIEVETKNKIDKLEWSNGYNMYMCEDSLWSLNDGMPN